MLRWDESILDIPSLVRLGYGDVPNPVIRHAHKAADDDDVSSMGGEPEDYRSMSITEQDKVDITQLQSVRRPDEEDEHRPFGTQPPPEEDAPDDNQSPYETQPPLEDDQQMTSIHENSKEKELDRAGNDDHAVDNDRIKEETDDEGESREIATAPSRDHDSEPDSTPSPPRKRSPPVVDATGIARPKFMDNFRTLLNEEKRERDDSDSSAKENNKRSRTAHADDNSPKRERSFTYAEDQAILEGVKKHGTGNWAKITAGDVRLDDLHSKDVRERYSELKREGSV